MIVVTGGAGFIGSNLVRMLNARGRRDILVVDDFTDGRKFVNLATAQIADYLDYRDFKTTFDAPSAPWPQLELVYHLGACSDTTEWDGRYMLETNFSYSKALLGACNTRGIPFVYASSAAVYGAHRACIENESHEQPLNVYGYSKLLFDQFVRQNRAKLAVRTVGIRYFNVYGPGEQHKGRMASVMLQFNKQMKETGRVRLFEGSHGLAAGEQRRDFVYVEDAAAMTLWCGEACEHSAIVNCGSGQANTFNAVARAILAWHGHGTIEYIPFPEDLRGVYQSDTRADLAQLRALGFDGEFRALAQGVADYLSWLNA